jgi:hypothetical protein
MPSGGVAARGAVVVTAVVGEESRFGVQQDMEAPGDV